MTVFIQAPISRSTSPTPSCCDASAGIFTTRPHPCPRAEQAHDRKADENRGGDAADGGVFGGTGGLGIPGKRGGKGGAGGSGTSIGSTRAGGPGNQGSQGNAGQPGHAATGSE